MRMITEQFIKQVLSEREKMQCMIHERIKSLFSELHNTDERIRSVSLGCMDGSGEYAGSRNHYDLGDILLKEAKLYKEQEREIREILQGFTEDLEAINRVWICFQMLDNQPYEILYRLYVKRDLYRVVEAKMGLNHRIFEEMRKRAVQDILKMYESDISNVEIIRCRWKQEKKKRKQIKQGFEQLSFDLRQEAGIDKNEQRKTTL